MKPIKVSSAVCCFHQIADISLDSETSLLCATVRSCRRCRDPARWNKQAPARHQPAARTCGIEPGIALRRALTAGVEKSGAVGPAFRREAQPLEYGTVADPIGVGEAPMPTSDKVLSMVVREPQAAGDYDDRTTAAVKSVLIEIGQILGSFEGKFAIIGGTVPWLLLGEAEMQHVGTVDVDLGLDPTALGDGEYAMLVETLQEHGYLQRDNLRRFQLVRTVPTSDGGPNIDVVVDFLMPRDAEITRNTPPLISQFAVQRADGTDLALRFYQMVWL